METTEEELELLNVVEIAKGKSANMIRALTPIIDQIAICHLRRQVKPKYFGDYRNEELDTIESYYVDLICEVLGVKR